eukprot:CAMPEP_0202449048 /NCGR_PEP_ID=MMETSP1360-20130828/7823_1 /ASSEMBLY_ACC=CAM_ASM_000848 /TAXON_ID=515479 /ORGANISM="Licmophora paradoxa, Strain CCMP2313" /LENGTH=359 /DNA_ID=CAMNT_0049066859 /DNA_START=32 /DNA_END=1111 /DNA_ORIENTATION=+
MSDDEASEESSTTTTTTITTEDDLAKWVVYLVVIAVFAVTIPILSKVPRSRGKNLAYHGIFFVIALLACIFVPDEIQESLFSEGSVLMVGTLIPVYESVIAVCTIGESDDVEWLQFWVVNASFTYATEFMDIIADNVPFAADHWYQFEFFTTLWFLLPWTDGSTLLYDVVTEPFLSPVLTRIKKAMDGKIEMLLAVVNSGYMWILWSTFLTLPEEARRFVVIAVGTVYPIIASTVSIAAKTEEETFWLTYWSTFSVLFILMDYLETWVGSIRGFYSICLCATVYLFLPMFRGADVVFRRVLVPVTGQYENMLIRDTELVRRQMERNIPANLHRAVFGKAANVFLAEKMMKKEENVKKQD